MRGTGTPPRKADLPKIHSPKIQIGNAEKNALLKEVRMRFVPGVVVGLILLSVCASGQAFSAQQTPDAQQKAALMKPITTAFSAAAAGNVKLFHEQYIRSSAIADEFAPFIWTGPNAQDRFFADFGKTLAELKMTDTKLVTGEPKYLYVAGARAYAVVPLKITANIAGKPYNESGWMTITLLQSNGVWKIASQSWAKGQENFNPY
jgi:hypothetical protein